jgi:hypothetical protein
VCHSNMRTKFGKLATGFVFVVIADSNHATVQAEQPIPQFAGRVVAECSEGAVTTFSHSRSIEYTLSQKYNMGSKMQRFDTPHTKRGLFLVGEVFAKLGMVAGLFAALGAVLLVTNKLTAEIVKEERCCAFYFVQDRTMQGQIEVSSFEVFGERFHDSDIICPKRFVVKSFKINDLAHGVLSA